MAWPSLVALAPWTDSSENAQPTVQVQVRVEEQTAPQYALVITLQLPAEQQQVVRRVVTKQQLARTLATAMRLRARPPVTEDELRADGRVRDWVEQSAAATPSRDEIVRWLLLRSVLVSIDDAGRSSTMKLLICGESGMEHPTQQQQVRDELPAHPPQLEQDPMDDQPPLYNDQNAIEEFDMEQTADEQAARETNAEDESVALARSAEWIQPKQPPAMLTRARSLRGEALVSATTTTGIPTQEEPKDQVITGSASVTQWAFEPTATRLRPSSRSVGDLRAQMDWSEDRRSFQLELRRSKQDVRATVELQKKAELIAAARRQQLLQQAQRKMQAADRAREESRRAKQLIVDTLEYHDITQQLETRVKQTKIEMLRERERIAKTTRVVLGHTDRWKKGPVIGPGPLSQLEIDIPKQERVRESVYDLHGRKHRLEDAPTVVQGSVFEAATKKLQRLLDKRSSESVALFREYDTNHSGTLDYAEFRRLLHANGISFTSEQADVFFRHFDPNRSGQIDYGELLWGFFNRRTFLKRWEQRKTRLSEAQIRAIFYEYDRTGRGALSFSDFHRAMDRIGFRMSENEVKMLSLKFDANHDGYIDYKEFYAFVNDGDAFSQTYKGSKKAKRASERTTAAPASESSAFQPKEEPADLNTILLELQELNLTQQKIRAKISR